MGYKLKFIIQFVLFVVLLNVNAAFAQVNTFTVTNTASSGAGSLKQAVLNANSTANLAGGNDVIVFNITPVAAPYTITISAADLIITDPVTIDGTTQTGYSGSPIICVDGFNYAFSFSGVTGSIVRGFSIVSCIKDGIAITGSSNITIENCWIGLLTDGTAPAGGPGNKVALNGINISASSSNIQVGGSTAAKSNVISACKGGSGISVANSSNVFIEGNYIGNNTTGTGVLLVLNAVYGINIISSTNVTVGGSVAGKRNIISGNTSHGIYVTGSSSIFIEGNYCGTNASGTAAIANGASGIYVNASSNVTVGGTTANIRNVLSGNADVGLYLNNVTSSNVINTIIGLNSAGTAKLANAHHGLYIDGGSNGVVIGGSTVVKRNFISGNGQNGLASNGGSHDNVIAGNFVGTDITGKVALGNTQAGVSATGGTNYIIGGSTSNERNVISGNSDIGIYMATCAGVTIQNNYIGTDSTGNVALKNNTDGMYLALGSDNADILNNVVSGNGYKGIAFESGVNNAEVYGNNIGVGADGITAIGNSDDGIFIHQTSAAPSSANSNIIGSTVASKRNKIAYNGQFGIHIQVTAGTANNNSFIANDIHCNGGQGIFIEGGAVANEGIAAPVITSSGANTISGTGTTGNTIHIYSNYTATSAACDCEGEGYLGTVTVVGGTWSFTHNLGLSTSEANSVSATQTSTTGSTSAFSACSSPIATLPIDFISLEVEANQSHNIISWVTGVTESATSFIISRSMDGDTWDNIGTIVIDHNSGQHFSFIDVNNLPSVICYYRIIEVGNDGYFTFSKIVSTSKKETNSILFNVYPNPAKHKLNIFLDHSPTTSDPIVATIYSLEGRIISQINLTDLENIVSLDNVPPGFYIIEVRDNNNSERKNIMVE